MTNEERKEAVDWLDDLWYRVVFEFGSDVEEGALVRLERLRKDGYYYQLPGRMRGTHDEASI